MKHMRGLVAAVPLLVISALSFNAHALGVEVRTPDTDGSFVTSAQARQGAHTIEVKIDTYHQPSGQYLDCRFGVDARDGGDEAVPANVGERVKGPLTPEVRTYKSLGVAYNSFFLHECKADDGSSVDASAGASVDVYPADAVTVDGACGSANGQPQISFPTNGAALCAAGEMVVGDSAGTDGTYNWSCKGKYGGDTKQCSAPVSVSQGGSFTGKRTFGLLGPTDTLTWNYPQATSCTASGAWSGTKAKSGSESKFYLLAAGVKTYAISCTGPGGTVTKSVTLQYQ